MKTYYVVYSFKDANGNMGFGRTTIESDRSMDRLDVIGMAEDAIRKNWPDFKNVFLISWKELEAVK